MRVPCLPHSALVLVLVVFSKAILGQHGCRSTYDIAQGADKSVCDVVAHSLNDKTGPFSRRLSFVDMVHKHPDRDPSTSICYTGAKTCCSIGLQASLAQAARKDFLTSFHTFLSSDSSSCTKAGAHYHTLKSEIETLLRAFVTYTRNELRKSVCTDTTLEFSLRLLDLMFEKENVLEYVKEHVVRLFFNVMVDHLQYRIQNPIQYTCVRDYLERIGSEHIENATRPLIVYFGKLRLLIKLSDHISTGYGSILQEDLTDSCMKELTRMQFCPSCSGHVCIRTCRGYCYDTVADCVSRIRVREIQRIGQAVNQLWSDLAFSTILSEFPKSVVSQFIPFLDSRSVEIRNKLSQCRVWYTNQDVTVSSERQTCNAQYGRAAGGFPSLYESLTVSPWIFAKCASDLSNVVSTLPDQVCKLDHYVGGYWVGWPCWTGHYIGRYFSTREGLNSPPQSEAILPWNVTALSSCSSSSECIGVHKSAIAADLTSSSFLSTPVSIAPPDPLLRNRIIRPKQLQTNFPRNKVPLLVLPFSADTPSD